jgi:ribosomal protein S27E
MALQDPVAVYTASSNVEAHMLSNALNDAGVEAHVLEDLNAVGFSWFGPVPVVHRPKVCVNRADVERAQPILLDYETRQSERHEAKTDTSLPVQIVCEDCGEKSVFAYGLLGTVQTCKHCGAFLDVELEGGESPDDFASEDIQEGEPEE